MYHSLIQFYASQLGNSGASVSLWRLNHIGSDVLTWASRGFSVRVSQGSQGMMLELEPESWAGDAVYEVRQGCK